MNKKFAKLLVLAALSVGAAKATEMRSPYLSERGPIRYTFEKENPDRYSLSIYSGVYTKEAEKAFLKHGTDTHPLSALFFNKADIPLKEIFPNSEVPNDTQYYNPWMKLGTIKPRVTYYETGVNLGGRFEYPVYKDKGRIGLRLNIPFKTIELEREDFFDKYEDPSDAFLVERQTTVGTNGEGKPEKSIYARIVRLDLINEMFLLNSGDETRNQALVFGDGYVKVFDNDIVGGSATKGIVNADDNKEFNAYKLEAGVLKAEKNARPLPHREGLFAFNVDNETTTGGQNSAERKSFVVTSDGTHPSAATYDFIKGLGFYDKNIDTEVADRDYSSLNNNLDYLETRWLVLGRKEGELSTNAKKISDHISEWLKLYDENSFEYFARNNFFFKTDRRTGFGDIDLDLFYEHTFSDEWVAEVMLGVRFPTGTDDDYYGNPYRAHLGNGEHWEIKLGAMGAWMPLDWMNVRLDGRFSFALEATEQRCAAFKGAKIKNIGPQVAADVDWQSFVLNLDFTFFHPKTDDLSTDIGYEFYYKTRDDVTQKKTTMESWLGHKWNTTTKAWEDNQKDLDNGLLESNTQAIGHKVRAESSYRFSDWFEMYAGGSYVFAGKYISRDSDIHAGMNVRF